MSVTHILHSKENGDWSAGGNCTPSANYWVQVAGHFILPITDSVCVAVSTLGNMESDLGAQSSSYQKA